MIMVKLKSECLSLKIDFEDIDLPSIICFSDASCAKLKGNYSQSSYILFLYKDSKLFSPIVGIHRKQRDCLKVLVQLGH